MMMISRPDGYLQWRRVFVWVVLGYWTGSDWTFAVAAMMLMMVVIVVIVLAWGLLMLGASCKVWTMWVYLKSNQGILVS
jgi:hypothetical protein